MYTYTYMYMHMCMYVCMDVCMFVCLDGCSDYFAYVSISTVGKTGKSRWLKTLSRRGGRYIRRHGPPRNVPTTVNLNKTDTKANFLTTLAQQTYGSGC